MKKNNTIKKIMTGILAATVFLTLTACGNNASSREVSGSYDFTDDCGRTVSVPEDLERIVASGPLSEIILYSLAPELLVATTQRLTESDAKYFPEDHMKLPYLGVLYGSAELNVEELAATDPQLVIDVGEAKKTLVEDMDALEAQTGIPSVHVEASLATMADAYRTLGKLLGREAKAEILAANCEETYNRTLQIMEKVGDKKVRAAYILGTEGLNVIAKDSYHAEVIDLITDNVAVVENPSGKGTGNEVSMEQIALWNPDFVVFAPESIYAEVNQWATWQNISAIQTGNYVEVPYGPYNWMGNPPSVQRYLALIWLPSILYPEYCEYDAKTEIMEYYKLYYGIELTDAQYSELTKNAWPGK